MAGVKISALPAAPSAQTTDIYPIVQGGVTYKLTTAQLITLINSSSVLTAFLPLAGGTMSGAIDMGTNLIHNVVDPVSAQDAATKNYVDTTALNGTSVYAASAATLGTVTQSGAGVGATLTNAGAQATFALDGVNPPVGSNVLIKNTSTGATAANEGIYTVTNAGSNSTNWVLTRASSYDTATEINNTGLILVQNGTTLVGTAWYNAATITTVDTDNFSYSEFGNIVFPINLAHGGTNAALTASNGGIFYSTASAGAILSGTATAGQVLISGASGAPSWSQSPTLSSINDTNGKEILLFTPTASAVNFLSIINNATGVAPGIVAAGTDSNITVSIASKGTGGVALSGFTDNSSASSGIVGEYISSNITSGSPNSLTTATLTNVTSISLTKGDWDVGGNVYGSFATTMTLLQGGISTTSATLPSGELTTYLNFASTSAIISSPVPGYKLSLAATTTVYLVIYGVGTGGSGACAGLLWARRRR